MKRLLGKFTKSSGRFITWCLAALLLISFSVDDQHNPIFDEIVGKLASYAARHSPEKVYVQTDKDIYTNGETIWFKTYLLDGIVHKATEKSEVVYVELLDVNDKIVARNKLQIDDLAAQSEISLPYDLESGNYLLRAYTKYMLNEETPSYFQKEIPIFEQDTHGNEKKEFVAPDNIENSLSLTSSKNHNSDQISVRFFPEGGDLVSGQTSIMGLKVSAAKGKSIEVEGSIIEEDGSVAAFFKSHAIGLGKVTFKPEANKKYYALVNLDGEEKRFLVPRAKPVGYVMNIQNNGDHLVLNVSTNIEQGLSGTYLLGHFRGDTFYKRIGTEKDGNSYSVKLKTDRLFDGVAHFTLFTEEAAPVCERLTFIDHPDNDIEVRIKSEAKDYGQRERVLLGVDAIDASGTFLKGDFAMSVVTKSNRLPDIMPRANIKSWLLLDSDLGGTVEDPSFFFEDNSNERKYLLDALMLTHGWRRFVWKEFLKDKVNKKMTQAPEKAAGTILSGYTASERNPKLVKQTTVSLRIPSHGINETKLTDAYGRFSFGPFQLASGEETFLEIVDESRKKTANKNIAIYLDKKWPKVPVKRYEKSSYPNPLAKTNETYELTAQQTNTGIGSENNIEAYLERAYIQKVNDFEYDPSVTKLKEVEVSAKKKDDELKKIEASSLHGTANIRVFTDSVATAGAISALDVIGQAAGVQVTGNFPDQTLRITTMGGFGLNGNILFLVNGTEVNFLFIQKFLFASEILYVDVLRGIEAAVYGMRASGGAILITTKSNRQRGTNIDNDSPDQVIPGFYKARQFFSPNYSLDGVQQTSSDFRTTLYWNPEIRIEDGNSPLIQFYTGDNIGDYLIKVEGLTRDGRAVVGYSEFSVQ